MKRKITLIAGIVFIIDQLIKNIVKAYLSRIVVIPNFFELIYAENDGVAFSMLSGNKVFIITLSLCLTFILIYYLKKDVKQNNDGRLNSIAYGLLFGGIIGNLFDRLVRGVVIDYISFNIFGYHFPIFNIADITIIIGVILMILSLKEGKMIEK